MRCFSVPHSWQGSDTLSRGRGVAGRVCSKHPGTGGSLNVPCAPVQPHQSWLVLENRWRAFWGFLVPISGGGGEVWWGVGQGKDFSQPPAWAQDFCQKHPHSPTPLPDLQTAGLVQPGRHRNSLRPPLRPSRETHRQNPLPRCEKLKSATTSCCSAAWGPHPSLLPLGRTGTGPSLDPCPAANSRSESVPFC